MNMKKIVDSRNPKVAMVQDDPLGEVFGVNAFHQCQVGTFLRGQLSPVIEHNETADVTSNSLSECEASTSTSCHVRKRLDSGSDSDDKKNPKMPRTQGSVRNDCKRLL